MRLSPLAHSLGRFEYSPSGTRCQRWFSLLVSFLATWRLAFPVGDAWTAQNPLATVLLGVALMLVVFVPLSVQKFAQISSR